MKIVLLLLLITLSEATIGVFVKLTDGLIPIQTLNFYALSFAAAFLMAVMPLATGRPLRFPKGNLKDTAIIGVLIATQISVFNYAMTLVPIANAVIFWSVAPFFVFIFSALFLGEKARKSYILIFAVALTGIVLAKPLEGGHMVGNLVALGDGAIYAAMVTYMRYEGKTEAGNDIAWSMLAGALMPGERISNFGVAYHSVTVFGTAEEVTDEEKRVAALLALMQKYFPDYRLGEDYQTPAPDELKRTAIYRISIETWSAKQNKNG